jgi:hypothetical protein
MDEADEQSFDGPEITQEIPIGVGGRSPHPIRGRVTTLRVLGTGQHLALGDRDEWIIGRGDPPDVDVQVAHLSVSCVHARMRRDDHGAGALVITNLSTTNRLGMSPDRGCREYESCNSIGVAAGHRFALGKAELLALDDRGARLAEELARIGAGPHSQIDTVLVAAIHEDPVTLHADHAAEVLDVARVLHEGSASSEFPFTVLDRDRALSQDPDVLCASLGFGAVLLDLTAPYRLPARLAANLLSDEFHVWPLLAARTSRDVFDAFVSRFDAEPRTRNGPPRISHLGQASLGYDRDPPPWCN